MARPLVDLATGVSATALGQASQFDRFDHAAVRRALSKEEVEDMAYVEVAYVVDAYTPDGPDAKKLSGKTPLYFALTSDALHIVEHSGNPGPEKRGHNRVFFSSVRSVTWYVPSERGEAIFADEEYNDRAIVLEVVHWSASAMPDVNPTEEPATSCFSRFRRSAADAPAPPPPRTTANRTGLKRLRIVSIERNSSLFRYMDDLWMRSLEKSVLAASESSVGQLSRLMSAAVNRAADELRSLARTQKDMVTHRLATYAKEPSTTPFATTPSAEIELLDHLTRLAIIRNKPDDQEVAIFNFLALVCERSSSMCRRCLLEEQLTKRCIHNISRFTMSPGHLDSLATTVRTSASAAGVRWRRLYSGMRRKREWRLSMASLRFICTMVHASVGLPERLVWWTWLTRSGYMQMLVKVLVTLSPPLSEAGNVLMSDVMQKLTDVFTPENDMAGVMGVLESTQAVQGMYELIERILAQQKGNSLKARVGSKGLQGRLSAWSNRAKKVIQFEKATFIRAPSANFVGVEIAPTADGDAQDVNRMHQVLLGDLHAPLAPILGTTITTEIAEAVESLLALSRSAATAHRGDFWKKFGAMSSILSHLTYDVMWALYQSLFVCCMDMMLYAAMGEEGTSRAQRASSLEQDASIGMRAHSHAHVLRFLHDSNQGLRQTFAARYGEEVEHVCRILTREQFHLRSLREPYHEQYDRGIAVDHAHVRLSVANHELWSRAQSNFMYVLETTWGLTELSGNRKQPDFKKMISENRSKVLQRNLTGGSRTSKNAAEEAMTSHPARSS